MTEQTADELLHFIDTYLPTIITGVNHLSDKAHQKAREDWTDDDLAVMAAYSAAHNLMKEVSGRRDIALVDYDLPSVLDMFESLKKRRQAIEDCLWKYPDTRDFFDEFEGRTF